MDDPCKQCETIEERNRFLRQDQQQLFDLLKNSISSPRHNHSNSSDNLEQQLQESQECYKRLSEASFEGIIIHSLGQEIIDVNQQFLDLYGYTSDELKQTPLMDLVAPQSRNMVAEKIASGFQGIYRAFAIKKDGTVFPVEVHVKEAFQDDRPVRIVAILDLTEQKQMEAKLEQSEIRFSQIFENVAEGILIADVETKKFAYVNPAMADMLGYSSQELLQLGISDIHPKEELDNIRDDFNKMINGQKITVESSCLKKDGSQIDVQIKGTVIYFGDKKYTAGFFSDITERKKIKKKLTESEQKYRELYDQAQIGLYRTRISDGKLLECNEALAKLLGYDSKEECLGDYYSAAHYVDSTRREELLKQLKKTGSVHGFEIEFVRRDGSHAWAEFSARIFPVKGYIEGVQADITASKILTVTEKSILDIILQGKSNKEIAKSLNRSVRTIEDHRAHIMHKLHAHNLVELVQKAQSFKLEQ